MLTCSNCDHENPEGQRFCGDCGTPLASTLARPVVEERKVVTSMFCDLVGFTSASESADPEDLDKMLNAYFEMARAQIESHGGVVEKFIGDAVVGVFGVPAAHEDDPERAVRAGLRICEDAEEMTSVGGAPLKLRVGINTGEALVRLGVSAASGEGFLTGDSVNTASRIQSVAPEMGVAVGLATYEATLAVFDYEELEPATVKGKAEPVRIFHAKAANSRLGTDLTRTHNTPFVGREIDLALLKGIFDKTLASTSPQLVTVIGEPGIGKSRIVAELGAYVDAKPELVTWRQGRCLPYGEGITFWALGEIVKAHAGILESDPPDVAEAKLDQVLPEGDERPWFRQRLLPLVGVETNASAEREESFTAWRRFLEHLSERNPTVLVFEDLHWADAAMLAFIEDLSDRAHGVPLLLVGTARPELFEHHPRFAARLSNANRINLSPLSEEETTRLISALLEAGVVPPQLRAPILERAGGNPLFAEEFVRLLKDRDLLRRRDASWDVVEDPEVPFPDTIQALIAARLDTLAQERKAMLADAAVIGKVFWAGAVAAMGDVSEVGVVDALRELSRKELVRPARRSSIEGEQEYAFWHVLVRDVAYAQLPRRARAARHVAAARWIESKANERLEDVADVLAHHYTSALALARLTGDTEAAAGAEAPAFRFLTLAGERALGLDTGAALVAFERALALAPPGHPERPQALVRFADAATQFGRFADAVAALREAIETFRSQGDPGSAARAMHTLVLPLQYLNESVSAIRATVEAALALVEPLALGPELVDALMDVAGEAAFFGRPEECIAYVERALAAASELGLPRPARGVGYLAFARCSLGDRRGLADFRESVALALQTGEARTAASMYNNFAITLRNFEGPASALEVFTTAAMFSEARGLQEVRLGIRTSALASLIDLGRLDDTVRECDVLRAEADAVGDEFDLLEILSMRTLALTYLGRAHEAHGEDHIVEAVRRTGRGDIISEVLGSVAQLHLARGCLDDARALLEEIESTPHLDETPEYPHHVGMHVRGALTVGDVALAERLAGHLRPRDPLSDHAMCAAEAMLAEARGDAPAAAERYAEAARRFEAFGVVTEQAFALLGQGRCLVGLSRPTEAAAVLQHAREIFERLKATPSLAETDALLARAIALSS